MLNNAGTSAELSQLSFSDCNVYMYMYSACNLLCNIFVVTSPTGNALFEIQVIMYHYN